MLAAIWTVALLMFVPQSAPSAGVAVPAKRTKVTRSDRAEWRKALQWPDECEASFGYPDPAFGGVDVYSVQRGLSIADITCTLGSYQGEHRFYLIDERHSGASVKPLPIPWFEEQNGRLKSVIATEVSANPKWNPARKSLTLLNRFRGPGGCGWLATYDLRTGAPRLTELRARLECTEQIVPPDRWPKHSH